MLRINRFAKVGFRGRWKVEGGRRIVCCKGYVGMDIEEVADDFTNSLVKI
jgi:hypothetical protein